MAEKSTDLGKDIRASSGAGNRGRNPRFGEPFVFVGRATSDRKRVHIRGVNSGTVWDVFPARAREAMGIPVKRRVVE